MRQPVGRQVAPPAGREILGDIALDKADSVENVPRLCPYCLQDLQRIVGNQAPQEQAPARRDRAVGEAKAVGRAPGSLSVDIDVLVVQQACLFLGPSGLLRTIVGLRRLVAGSPKEERAMRKSQDALGTFLGRIYLRGDRGFRDVAREERRYFAGRVCTR